MLKNNNIEALQELMATKSDLELNEYITEFEKCTASELSTAIAELKKRGKVFNDTEWQDLLSKVSSKLWAKTPNIPKHYSPMTILRLSFFFSVLFGAIVFSTNLKTLREKYVVICFGLTYLLSQLTLAKIFPSYLSLHISIHLIGCAMLYPLFWKNYLGNRYYLRRSAGPPIFLGVLLLIGLLYGIHFYIGHQHSLSFCIGWQMGNFVAQWIR